MKIKDYKCKCGHDDFFFINPITKDLTVRDWTCPQCGAYHDRDENAADNILAEGKRMVELQKVNSNSDEFQIAS